MLVKSLSVSYASQTQRTETMSRTLVLNLRVMDFSLYLSTIIIRAIVMWKMDLVRFNEIAFVRGRSFREL